MKNEKIEIRGRDCVDDVTAHAYSVDDADEGWNPQRREMERCRTGRGIESERVSWVKRKFEKNEKEETQVGKHEFAERG